MECSPSIVKGLLVLLLLAAPYARAETASALMGQIRVAHEDYDLPTFYALSRRFLKEHAEHQAADRIRYEMAVQLVAENLKTPQSDQGKEAIELLRFAAQHGRSDDARFDAALLLLKFEPTPDPGKSASEVLRRFPRHPDSGEIYGWAIAELEARHQLEAAAHWAGLLLENNPKSPLAERCRKLIHRAKALGRPAPLSERERRVMAKLGGRIVVLDFFATWCEPCIESIPKLLELVKRREKDGLRVVGIAMDDDQEKLIRFKQENAVPWPFIQDSFSSDVDERFGVVELPTYIIIEARTGKILESELAGDAMIARVSSLLDQR